MTLLLDTHILLWWLADDKALSPALRDLIGDTSNPIYVSAASVWEIVIKKQLNKLTCPDGIVDVIEDSDFKALPISFSHSQAIAALPLHHHDPFDRMLIAQAICERMTLATCDERIRQYNVATVR